MSKREFEEAPKRLKENTHHVFPINDLFPHIRMQDECPCGPSIVSIKDEVTGETLGFTILHNAWDERELWEGCEYYH